MSALVRQELAVEELDAGSDFVVAEWTAQPPSSGERELVAPVHIHCGDDEAWYVLEGTLGFSFDGVDSLCLQVELPSPRLGWPTPTGTRQLPRRGTSSS